MAVRALQRRVTPKGPAACASRSRPRVRTVILVTYHTGVWRPAPRCARHPRTSATLSRPPRASRRRPCGRDAPHTALGLPRAESALESRAYPGLPACFAPLRAPPAADVPSFHPACASHRQRARAGAPTGRFCISSPSPHPLRCAKCRFFHRPASPKRTAIDELHRVRRVGPELHSERIQHGELRRRPCCDAACDAGRHLPGAEHPLPQPQSANERDRESRKTLATAPAMRHNAAPPPPRLRRRAIPAPPTRRSPAWCADPPHAAHAITASPQRPACCQVVPTVTVGTMPTSWPTSGVLLTQYANAGCGGTVNGFAFYAFNSACAVWGPPTDVRYTACTPATATNNGSVTTMLYGSDGGSCAGYVGTYTQPLNAYSGVGVGLGSASGFASQGYMTSANGTSSNGLWDLSARNSPLPATLRAARTHACMRPPDGRCTRRATTASPASRAPRRWCRRPCRRRRPRSPPPTAQRRRLGASRATQGSSTSSPPPACAPAAPAARPPPRSRRTTTISLRRARRRVLHAMRPPALASRLPSVLRRRAPARSGATQACAAADLTKPRAPATGCAPGCS